LDTALKATALIREEVPGLKFQIYGTGDGFMSPCLELVEELGLGGIVNYHGFVPIEEIASAISGIDVGIIPNRRTVFTEINFPVRIFEYLAQEKPVIVPRTQGILDYFGEESLFYFEAGSPESLAETILRVRKDVALRKRVLAEAMEVYSRHRWEVQKAELFAGLNSLLVNRDFMNAVQSH
jgi:glycosyltransferase involved in cell wall biosynthesis